MEGAWTAQVGTENGYKYNGKELNEDFGLGLYDYGARWYDPAMGRWNQIDPLSEKYFSQTGYQYVSNNPVLMIDPFGLFGESPNEVMKERQARKKKQKNGESSNGDQNVDLSNYLELLANFDSGNEKKKDWSKFKEVHDLAGPNDGVKEPSSEKAEEDCCPGVGLALTPAATVPLTISEFVPGIGWVIIGSFAVAELERNLSEKIYVTYTKKNPLTGSIYVGRTSGYGDVTTILKIRDYNHNLLRLMGYEKAVPDRFAKGLLWPTQPGFATGTSFSAYVAIRGREQALYDYYKNQGVPLGNRIQPISPINPLRPLYKWASNAFFGPIK